MKGQPKGQEKLPMKKEPIDKPWESLYSGGMKCNYISYKRKAIKT